MIKLGDKVKDSITGFEGIATAKIEYLNGCIRIESQWIDQQQLEKGKKKESGGPGSKPKAFSTP